MSGGQTGVDRAALDAALEAGFPCGGWCPAGRLAEDGVISERYPLREIPGGDYTARTLRNVVDSDGTLIVHHGPMRGGTHQTWLFCRAEGKPVCAFDMEQTALADAIRGAWEFVDRNKIRILNVAGPRASQWPGGYEVARQLVRALLSGR